MMLFNDTHIGDAHRDDGKELARLFWLKRHEVGVPGRGDVPERLVCNVPSEAALDLLRANHPQGAERPAAEIARELLNPLVHDYPYQLARVFQEALALGRGDYFRAARQTLKRIKRALAGWDAVMKLEYASATAPELQARRDRAHASIAEFEAAPPVFQVEHAAATQDARMAERALLALEQKPRKPSKNNIGKVIQAAIDGLRIIAAHEDWPTSAGPPERVIRLIRRGEHEAGPLEPCRLIDRFRELVPCAIASFSNPLQPDPAAIAELHRMLPEIRHRLATHAAWLAADIDRWTAKGKGPPGPWDALLLAVHHVAVALGSEDTPETRKKRREFLQSPEVRALHSMAGFPVKSAQDDRTDDKLDVREGKVITDLREYRDGTRDWLDTRAVFEAERAVRPDLLRFYKTLLSFEDAVGVPIMGPVSDPPPRR